MIGKGFADHPQLPEPFPSLRKYWTCPKTGLKVPMLKDANLKYRERLLVDAERDPVLQADVLAACAISGLYWLNVFGWTYWQFETDPETGKSRPAKITHQPMITWECQEIAWNAFEEAFFGGEDIGVRKSRDMGASWLCTFFIHHKWLFRPDTQIREMSRTEDYVDGPTSKSLFWKHDYANTWLPEWMRPPGVTDKGTKNRTKLRIHNELNDSTIAGESTTKHAMSGDRCQILLLDEFAKVENGEEIRTATADVSPCRIVNSTPAGAGTEYSRWLNSGQIKVVSLKFWDHPEKGAGRFVLKDPITNRFQISSPWLEHQKQRRTSKEIAQEVYAEDLEAGDTFYDVGELEKHAALFAREPTGRYNICLKERTSNDDIPDILKRRDQRFYSLRKVGEGKLEVWVELIDGRLDQSKTYIFGIDTSTGRGASESVVSIRCKQTGEIVAKWRCRNTPPYEFARVIVALALWCGGANPQRLPFLKWEKNGPGLDLGKLIVKDFKYPFYYRNQQVGTVGEKKTDKYGWHSSREGKQLLLQAYGRALLTGKIINHDKRGIEQAKYYIYYPGGGVGPAELQDKNQAEMLLHGDVVIADALTVDDSEVNQPKPASPSAPTKSWGYRFEQWKQSKLKDKGWRRKFNFRN
jgi:hypothetical protein